MDALALDLRNQSGTSDPGAATPDTTEPGGDGGGGGIRYRIAAQKDNGVVPQERSYWCGPATLKNMVRVMHKERYGNFSSPSQATLASWLGTTQSGTWIGAFPNVLNSHFANYGTWRLVNPGTKVDYLADVEVDTHDYHQPVIVGVATEELRYYDGWALDHFIDDYGFDTRKSTKWIYMADPFDPKFLGYAHYPVNPHGKHKDHLARAFRANNLSGTYPDPSHKRMVL